MQIGFIGLGKMGTRMVGKLIEDKHKVIAWNRTVEDSAVLKKMYPELTVAEDIENLVLSLEAPRVVWIMVSHAAVEDVLAEVKKYIEAGDVIIDGGNSHFSDTQRRFEEFEKVGIHFMGVGTSGGILAADNGYPFMVGGSIDGYSLITPLLDTLSRPNGGHEYFGRGGAGHFVKMVHNGIEYGIMQSLGEGFDVLKNSDYQFDLLKVSKLWQKGTLVSGFMLDRATDALEKGDIDTLSGVINASGEAKWTIEEARKERVEVPVIEKSLEYREQSQSDPKIQNSYTAKMVAALRREFGGHEVKKS
jgi:6-phosphogluconate dehydrogenase